MTFDILCFNPFFQNLDFSTAEFPFAFVFLFPITFVNACSSGHTGMITSVLPELHKLTNAMGNKKTKANGKFAVEKSKF